MLQSQMLGEVVGLKVRLTTRRSRTHRTYYFHGHVRVLRRFRVFRRDVIEQGRVTEAFLGAIRTSKALELARGRSTAISDIQQRPRENALHGVLCSVSSRRRIALIALRAQIVVVADQALVPSSAEVAFHTEIAADS